METNECLVPLSRGLFAIVDPEDYDDVMQYRWCALRSRHTFYAVRYAGVTVRESMHKFLTGFRITDHINGEGLDNRRSNLREATTEQNNRNARAKVGASKYKGVGWDSQEEKWRARMQLGKKRLSLGRFTSEEEAARAYDAAARKHYGEFAALNFPEPGEQSALRSEDGGNGMAENLSEAA